MRLAERVARARDMAAREFECDARHQLESQSPCRRAPRAGRPRSSSAAAGVSSPTSEVATAAGRVKQAKGRCRHARRACLGADEKLLQVVARAVLAQCAESWFNTAPVRQHDLEAEHEGAHHAVAQYWPCRSALVETMPPSVGPPSGRATSAAARLAAAAAGLQPRQARSPPPAVRESFCADTARDLSACAGATAGSRCRAAAASHRRNSW